MTDDPTLSKQLKQGFRFSWLLVCWNTSTEIISFTCNTVAFHISVPIYDYPISDYWSLLYDLKTSDNRRFFLMFSGGIELEQLNEMG